MACERRQRWIRTGASEGRGRAERDEGGRRAARDERSTEMRAALLQPSCWCWCQHQPVSHTKIDPLPNCPSETAPLPPRTSHVCTALDRTAAQQTARTTPLRVDLGEPRRRQRPPHTAHTLAPREGGGSATHAATRNAARRSTHGGSVPVAMSSGGGPTIPEGWQTSVSRRTGVLRPPPCAQLQRPSLPWYYCARLFKEREA